MKDAGELAGARALAQAAADDLKRGTRAEYTITIAVLGLAGAAEDSIIVGACVPDQRFAALILRAVAESIDDGTAHVEKADD